MERSSIFMVRYAVECSMGCSFRGFSLFFSRAWDWDWKDEKSTAATRAARENCRHRIQQGEAERFIVLSPTVFVAPMLAIFVFADLDSDGGDRDSRRHRAQCVAGSAARVARSGTALLRRVFDMLARRGGPCPY